MVKRFCDTEIWQKDWFLDLDDKQKLLVKFIFDSCDCAGIYQISWKMLKVFFNSEIKKEDFLKIKNLRFIDENTIFVENFVKFQCGISHLNELNPNNNAHKGIIKKLKKYNLILAPNEPQASPTLAPSEGLTSPKPGAQEKEMEKEKEKEKNISSSLVLSSSFENAEKELEKKLSFPNPPQKKTKPKNQAFRDNLVKLYKEREGLKEGIGGVLSG